MNIRFIILAGIVGLGLGYVYVVIHVTSQPTILEYHREDPDPVVIPFEFERDA